MNALLSRSGIFLLMNSSRDGRISSAIIPLWGDFVFLQIWQTSGAVLIGIRCRIKPLLQDCRYPLESTIELWGAHAPRVLASAPSRSRTFSNAQASFAR